ncbi:MAG: DMT family transporter [Traorella sp.]
MRVKGILLTILSGLLYGFAPILCAITYSYGNNAVTTTFFRGFFGALMISMIIFSKKINLRISLIDFIKIMCISLFGQVITTILLYGSINYIGAGTSTTLHFLYPLFVTLLCHYVYKDPLTKKHVFSLCIALLGIATFINLNDLTKLTGVLMALTSGFTFSIYLVGVEKLHLSKMNDFVLTFYISLCMCGLTFIYGCLSHELVLIQPIQSYGLLLLIAILAQIIAVTCLKKGIEILGSSLASLLSMFEPVTSVVFGVILLHEDVSIVKVIGCFLILLSIYLLIKPDKKNGFDLH